MTDANDYPCIYNHSKFLNNRCNKKFKYQKHLLDHIVNDHLVVHYQCIFVNCDKIFTNFLEFNNHINHHDNMSCQYCNYKSIDRINLLLHDTLLHPQIQPKSDCKIKNILDIFIIHDEYLKQLINKLILNYSIDKILKEMIYLYYYYYYELSHFPIYFTREELIMEGTLSEIIHWLIYNVPYFIFIYIYEFVVNNCEQNNMSIYQKKFTNYINNNFQKIFNPIMEINMEILK